MKKKLKGFTLIELIVVIAIIGVLAAILVPAMMGWVIKSRVTTYNNNAAEIVTQLQIALTDFDQAGIEFIENGDIEYSGVAGGFGTAYSDDVRARLDAINDTLKDMSTSQWIARIDHNTVQSVVFTGNDYKTIGAFPCQCTKETVFVGKSHDELLSCAKKGWTSAS